MSLGLAISNEGARAGVLTRIDFANVESVGWSEFAEATTKPDYYLPTIADAGDGRPLGLPTTLAPGGIATVPNQLQAEGCCLHGGWHDAQPDLTPLAVGLSNLQELRLEARVQYRRAKLFGGEAEEKLRDLLVPCQGVPRPCLRSLGGRWPQASRSDCPRSCCVEPEHQARSGLALIELGRSASRR